MGNQSSSQKGSSKELFKPDLGPKKINKSNPTSSIIPTAQNMNIKSINKFSIVWQWQSNTNPWSASDPTWTAYEPTINYKLEKSFLDKKENIDTGEYIISLKEMIQRRKDDSTRQRRIRRIEEEPKEKDQESFREYRYFDPSFQKPTNKPHGAISNMMIYIENRSHELREFTELVKTAEEKNDIIVITEKIIPLIIEKIQEESNILKSNASEIIQALNKPFSSMVEFYHIILKIYTMESFLFRQLNKMLRSEKWFELDNLMPYLYCLYKAFLSKELNLLAKPPQNPVKFDISSQVLTLYRGASMDKSTLGWFELSENKYFSWNGVTSTSRNLNIALSFMNMNKMSDQMASVLFIIYLPLDAKTVNSIDVKPFSRFPGEEEIILAPGTVFEFLLCEKKGPNDVEITLKVVSEFNELKVQGQMFQGIVLSEVVMGGEVNKISGFKDKLLEEAICNLKGNKLTNKLELSLCTWTEKSCELPGKVLESTNIRIIQLTSNIFSDNTFESLFNKMPGNQIQELIIPWDKNNEKESMKYFAQGIGSLRNSLRKLSLDFSKYRQIDDSELNDLSQGIQALNGTLTHLDINFEICRKITGQGLMHLSKGLQDLSTLTHLKLNFLNCHLIGEQGVMHLSQGIQCLCKKLTQLDLNFSYYFKMSDQELIYLAQGIQSLMCLTHLDLKFRNCHEITNKGLKELTQGIQALKTSLTHLNLVFLSCWSASKQDLENLSKSMTGLIEFQLDESKVISQAKLNDIEVKIKDVSFDLELKFSRQHILSSNHKTKALRNSCEFQTMRPENFLKNSQLLVENEAVGIHFRNNESLSTDISACMGQLKLLKALTELTLDFRGCHQIRDEELKVLSQGLQQSSSNLSLRYLNINFAANTRITDQGLLYIFEGIMSLKSSLTSLQLDFGGCCRISNQGLTYISQGIQSLNILLTDLKLSFRECCLITNQGLKELSQGIQSLASLKNLSLNFENDVKISDEGLNYISQGIEFLDGSITNLNLNFRWCSEISDLGLKYLSQKLNIPSLVQINLDFDKCHLITIKEGVGDFEKSLAYLGFDRVNELDFLE